MIVIRDVPQMKSGGIQNRYTNSPSPSARKQLPVENPLPQRPGMPHPPIVMSRSSMSIVR